MIHDIINMNFYKKLEQCTKINESISDLEESKKKIDDSIKNLQKSKPEININSFKFIPSFYDDNELKMIRKLYCRKIVKRHIKHNRVCEKWGWILDGGKVNFGDNKKNKKKRLYYVLLSKRYYVYYLMATDHNIDQVFKKIIEEDDTYDDNDLPPCDNLDCDVDNPRYPWKLYCFPEMGNGVDILLCSVCLERGSFEDGIADYKSLLVKQYKHHKKKFYEAIDI